IGEFMQVFRNTRLSNGTSGWDLLRRPDMPAGALLEMDFINGKKLREILCDPASRPLLEQIQIEARYSGYIQREKRAAERLRELDGKMIPRQMDFSSMPELRKEAREALGRFQPQTIGQASRLEGITPSDLMVLSLFITGRG
ncbi:MAG TPA: hypothetical protein VKJ65_12150, partial [Phycisphaerae bacterium]|nr:hypothetical protein [Phycisphaerae bacterium]